MWASTLFGGFRLFQRGTRRQLTRALMLTTSFAVDAEETSLKIAARETHPPYTNLNAESGIEIEIITAIFRDMNIQPVFVQAPRGRGIQMFNTKAVDVLLAQNPSSTPKGCATDWYIIHQNVGLSVKSRDLQLNTLDDLEPFSVISFLGASMQLGPTYAAAANKAKLYRETGDQDLHIQMLYEQHFDVAVGDIWTLRLAQQRYLGKEGVYIELIAHEILPPTRYIARFHDLRYCRAFNTSLKKIRQSGVYDRIWMGYEGRQLTKSRGEK